MRRDIAPYDLLRAVGNLSVADREHTSRMVDLMVDGMRFGADKA